MPQNQYLVSANTYPNGALKPAFNIPPGSHAVVSVSGTWQYDPHAGRCGAGGNGAQANSNGFPAPAGSIGCLVYYVWPAGANFPGNGDTPLSPQDVLGWFTADNQVIDFGGTSPGDGDYYFYMNDNDYDDNAFSLTLTVDTP